MFVFNFCFAEKRIVVSILIMSLYKWWIIRVWFLEYIDLMLVYDKQRSLIHVEWSSVFFIIYWQLSEIRSSISLSEFDTTDIIGEFSSSGVKNILNRYVTNRNRTSIYFYSGKYCSILQWSLILTVSSITFRFVHVMILEMEAWMTSHKCWRFCKKTYRGHEWIDWYLKWTNYSIFPF